MLAYLEEELELKGEDLKKVVKSFPEVINCNVERRLKANVEHMQKVTMPQRLILIQALRFQNT